MAAESLTFIASQFADLECKLAPHAEALMAALLTNAFTTMCAPSTACTSPALNASEAESALSKRSQAIAAGRTRCPELSFSCELLSSTSATVP